MRIVQIMHPQLLDIIDSFRQAQDRGVRWIVEVLGSILGVPLPKSNREWVTICGEYGLYQIHRVNGVEIYAHGYGIELIFPDLTIDFDWGESGEPDGFDTWRLWNFLSINKRNVGQVDYTQIRSWLEEAYQLGELTREGIYSDLYYSPAHRVGKEETNPESSMNLDDSPCYLVSSLPGK
jgi:hypothetical protein